MIQEDLKKYFSCLIVLSTLGCSQQSAAPPSQGPTPSTQASVSDSSSASLWKVGVTEVGTGGRGASVLQLSNGEVLMASFNSWNPGIPKGLSLEKVKTDLTPDKGFQTNVSRWGHAERWQHVEQGQVLSLREGTGQNRGISILLSTNENPLQILELDENGNFLRGENIATPDLPDLASDFNQTVSTVGQTTLYPIQVSNARVKVGSFNWNTHVTSSIDIPATSCPVTGNVPTNANISKLLGSGNKIVLIQGLYGCDPANAAVDRAKLQVFSMGDQGRIESSSEQGVPFSMSGYGVDLDPTGTVFLAVDTTDHGKPKMGVQAFAEVSGSLERSRARMWKLKRPLVFLFTILKE